MGLFEIMMSIEGVPEANLAPIHGKVRNDIVVAIEDFGTEFVPVRLGPG